MRNRKDNERVYKIYVQKKIDRQMWALQRRFAEFRDLGHSSMVMKLLQLGIDKWYEDQLVREKKMLVVGGQKYADLVLDLEELSMFRLFMGEHMDIWNDYEIFKLGARRKQQAQPPEGRNTVQTGLDTADGYLRSMATAKVDERAGRRMEIRKT